MTRRGALAIFAAGLVAGAALAGSRGGAAASYDVAQQCTVAALNFVLDGVATTPNVPDGDPPDLDCNGTSYVPTRFIATALGQTVAWDATTQTVAISPAMPGTSCRLDVTVAPAAAAASDTVTVSYEGQSETLSAASQSLDLPCGTSALLTEQPDGSPAPAFLGWSVQTASAATGSTDSTLELRVSSPTSVTAEFAPAPDGSSTTG